MQKDDSLKTKLSFLNYQNLFLLELVKLSMKIKSKERGQSPLLFLHPIPLFNLSWTLKSQNLVLGAYKSQNFVVICTASFFIFFFLEELTASFLIQYKFLRK